MEAKLDAIDRRRSDPFKDSRNVFQGRMGVHVEFKGAETCERTDVNVLKTLSCNPQRSDQLVLAGYNDTRTYILFTVPTRIP